MSDEEGPACPLPRSRYPHVILGHGSGGRLGADLLRDVFLEELGALGPDPALEDQAFLTVPGGRIAMTTDAFVVSPRTFPGGDIGELAVYGTVNDLAVGGAVPRWLSAAFILEEGLALDELRTIVRSMKAACDRTGVQLVTGDTKVVERGSGDGVFITTTGIGVVPEGRSLSAANAREGDAVLLSGTIGDHGTAVMCAREELGIVGDLRSDCAPVHELAEALLAAAPGTRAMRDPTRGGLASALNEIAVASRVAMRLDEDAIPVRPAVHGVCELLGLDPLYVANEGKLVAIVPDTQAEAALAALLSLDGGSDAAIVGQVHDGPPGRVSLRTAIGQERLVPLLSGEQLPRIC